MTHSECIQEHKKAEEKNLSTKCEPINPQPPVTKILVCFLLIEPSFNTTFLRAGSAVAVAIFGYDFVKKDGCTRL